MSQRTLNYPTRDLITAIITTVVALVLLSATLFFSLHISRQTENIAIPTRELQLDVLYQAGRARDAVLLFWITGDAHWEKQYLSATSNLNRSLETVMKTTGSEKVRQAFQEVKTLSAQIDALGKEALNRSQGPSASTLQTFSDQQYLLMEERLADTVRGISDIVNTERYAQLRKEQSLIIAALMTSFVIGIIILPVVWIRLLSSHFAWRDALRADNLARTQAEERLQIAYNEVNRDLGIARELQRRQLPPASRLTNLSFEWFYEPAQHIGGDTLGYFCIDERHIAFYVIDVAGHGVASSLLAFNAQRQVMESASRTATLLKQLNGNMSATAEVMVQEFNKSFMLVNDPGLYFTMVYAICDSSTGELALVQAGHPPPIMISSDGRHVAPLGEGGLPIGILPEAAFDAVCVTLAEGDRLYLYSDGLTECRNAEGEEFREDRLMKMGQECAGLPLDEASRQVHERLVSWRGGGHSFDDDLTFLAIEFSIRHLEQASYRSGAVFASSGKEPNGMLA